MKHIPRGEMCLTCTKLYNDCSKLDFSSMQVLEKDKKEPLYIVKCSEFIKVIK